MVTVSNGSLALSRDQSTGEVSIHDRARGTRWLLDTGTRTFRREPRSQAEPLGVGSSTVLGDNAIREVFDLGTARLYILWELLDDGLALTLQADDQLPPPHTLMARTCQ